MEDEGDDVVGVLGWRGLGEVFDEEMIEWVLGGMVVVENREYI